MQTKLPYQPTRTKNSKVNKTFFQGRQEQSHLLDYLIPASMPRTKQFQLPICRSERFKTSLIAFLLFYLFFALIYFFLSFTISIFI